MGAEGSREDGVCWGVQGIRSREYEGGPEGEGGCWGEPEGEGWTEGWWESRREGRLFSPRCAVVRLRLDGRWRRIARGGCVWAHSGDDTHVTGVRGAEPHSLKSHDWVGMIIPYVTLRTRAHVRTRTHTLGRCLQSSVVVQR